MKPDNYSASSPTRPAEANISGTIEFQGVTEPVHDATVYVRVQDTQRADAPATTVAEQVLNNVNIVPEGERLQFKVEGIPLNPNARYTVRVHADVDGDGKVSCGDYISTQSYPLEMRGKQERVAIVARRVG